ncbi:hypothetical protein E1281_00655 [Actinomadura sp. KC345]|uniref:hypothetical protein n=1 Tax=Actinomadura sp. KC345 TaxID=2530371 RepID=UPI00104DDF21|nr:hypothetical protein [Actinomadura sp. KC345]TDC58651.1 hypothetical protein E1281_00655 [Actinomadura sp. KC345]
MDERRLVDAARLAVAEGSRQERYEALGALSDLLRGAAFTQDSAERVAAFLVEVALTSRYEDDREEALHALGDAGYAWPYQLVKPLADAVPPMGGAESDHVQAILENAEHEDAGGSAGS